MLDRVLNQALRIEGQRHECIYRIGRFTGKHRNCVLGPQGNVVEELQAASEPEALVRAVGSLRYSIDAIGLEAGPLSQWLSKGIEESGFDVVLMETRVVKAALKAMPIKTDRRDA